MFLCACMIARTRTRLHAHVHEWRSKQTGTRAYPSATGTTPLCMLLGHTKPGSSRRARMRACSRACTLSSHPLAHAPHAPLSPLMLPHERRHSVMHGLLPPATLTAVREEIVTNIQATYKETDLFKVFQTGASSEHWGITAGVRGQPAAGQPQHLEPQQHLEPAAPPAAALLQPQQG